MRRDAVAVERRAAMAEMMKAKNEARMAKAMGQLRAVATESAGRREAAKAAAAAAPAPKPAAAGGAGTSEPKERKVSDLPEEVVSKIKELTGESSAFNLARVFLLGTDSVNIGDYKRRANAILLILNGIAKGDDSTGRHRIEFEAKESEVPTKYASSVDGKGGEILKELYPIKPFEIEVLSRDQDRMLERGFKHLNVGTERIKAAMRKSKLVLEWRTDETGLNMRTKAGKEEYKRRVEEDAKTAQQYLERIAAKGKEFFKFMEGKVAAKKEEKAKAKEAARAVFAIPATQAKAEYVDPADFENVYMSFYGDEERARQRAKELREAYPGKRIKFFGRARLNLMVER